MDILIPDFVLYGLLIIIGTYVLFALFILTSLKNVFFTILKNKLFGGRIAQVFYKTGGSYMENQKYVAGFYEGSAGAWQSCVNGVHQGADYPFIIENEKLGVCLTINAAAGIKALTDMGYNDLAEAVAKWDNDVINWNAQDLEARKNKLIKEIEETKELSQEQKDLKIEAITNEYVLNDIKIQEIVKRGRNQLMELKLDFYTPYVIPLQQVYTWAIQEIDAINNKNVLIQVKLQTRELMAKENTALLTPNNVLLFMMILIGGAVAIYILTQGGHVSLPQNPIPTTSLP